MAGMTAPATYYKPPTGAVAILLLASRRGRRSHLHQGARSSAVLMTPEACNLDQASQLDELGVLGEVMPPTDADACHRCFPDGSVPAPQPSAWTAG